MKLSNVIVAGAAALSLGAWAADESTQQPQAQSGQTESQSASSAQPSTSAPNAQTSPNSGTVKQAQEKLSAAGHDAGPADGKLGPKTQAAVKEFQQSKGLDQTGQLDQQTLAALDVSEGSASTGSSSSSSGAGGDSSAGSAASPSSGASSESQEQPKAKSTY